MASRKTTATMELQELKEHKGQSQTNGTFTITAEAKRCEKLRMFQENKKNERVEGKNMQEKKLDLTTESLFDTKELSKKIHGRIELLAKVKSIFLLSGLELMTVQQVAEHYNVKAVTIKKVFAKNKEEILQDGVRNMTASQIYQNLPNAIDYKKVNDNIILTLKSGQEILLEEAENILFSNRAVIRIGMLMDDGSVVREVRTQLLNVSGNATCERKVEDLSNELEIIKGAINGYGTHSMTEVLESLLRLAEYRDQHKEESGQK